MTKEYDLVVLGGGPGGYVAAIRAAQLGMNVAIVESNNIGGTCLHRGCIPSKALLKTAEIYRQTKEASAYGIKLSDIDIDYEQAQMRKSQVVDQLHQGIKMILRREKIDVFYGFGRILGPSIFSPMAGTISVEYEDGRENTMIVPKYVIIATGSKPRTIPDMQIDGKFILNSEQVLDLKQLPKSMIIIGGGVTGIETASMLTDLGVDVTVIDAEDILAQVDEDIRRELKIQLQKRGVTFYTKASIDKNSINIDDKKENVSLEITYDGTPKILTAEKIFLSVGRVANIDEIGLSNTAIEFSEGVISTNEMYQTKESHIYAIGDCIGGLQLAHVASKEGIIAVEHMAGLQPEPLNEEMVPSCIYSFPEISQVGLTEREAIDKGYEIKIGKFPFQANGKAQVVGESIGFIKIISDQNTDDILGVHMIGENVTEMVSEATLAKVLNASVWEITQTIHPHPTLSESFFEAALAVDKKQIHG